MQTEISRKPSVPILFANFLNRMYFNLIIFCPSKRLFGFVSWTWDLNEWMLLHLWVNSEISADNKWWNQTKQQARHLAWHAEILTIRDNAIHFNRFTLNNLPIWKFSKNPKFRFSKFIKNNWYHAKRWVKRFHSHGKTKGIYPQPQK